MIPCRYFRRIANCLAILILDMNSYLLSVRSTLAISRSFFPKWNKLRHGIRLVPPRLISLHLAGVSSGLSPELSSFLVRQVPARPPRAVPQENFSLRATRLGLAGFCCSCSMPFLPGRRIKPNAMENWRAIAMFESRMPIGSARPESRRSEGACGFSDLPLRFAHETELREARRPQAEVRQWR